jgi:hypothetical protein
MPTITVQVEKCSIEGCNKPASAKGYCTSHYRRFQQYGDPMHTARQFHGIPTKVVGVSLPQALIDAAGAEAGEGEKAVTVLAKKLVESSWGKKALDAAGVDLKNAGAIIVPRNRGAASEEKPKKAKKAKKEAA